METRHSARLAAVVVAMAVALSGLAAPKQADARNPADVYKAKITLSPIPYPARFKNDAEFVAHIKRSDTREFWQESADGGWSFFYMAFFAKPLTGSSYLVLFYDVTEKDAPILVTQTTSHPTGKGLRIMSGDFELSTTSFKPDRRYLMLYTESVDQPALAETEFVLRAFDPDRASKVKAQREAEAQRQREEAEAEKARAREKSAPTWTPPDW